MTDDDELPTHEGHEMVENVVGVHERVLRNLALAAAATSDSDRKWYLDEAEEMHLYYLEKVKALGVWLNSRGVTYPSP